MLPPPAPDDCDEKLVARCQAGERAAFDEIVARHGARLHRVCFHALGDADEAADATQDALVRAWRGLPNFRGDSALSTWLHRIALNVVHDRLAKRKREPLPFSAAPSNDENDESPEARLPDNAPSPEAVALTREKRYAVRHALAQLSEDHRAALILFDIEGRSYEEAAAILQLPMGTLKSRLSRARLALRDLLLEQRELFEA